MCFYKGNIWYRGGGEAGKQECWNWFGSVSKINLKWADLDAVTKIWGEQSLKGSSPAPPHPQLAAFTLRMPTTSTQTEDALATDVTALEKTEAGVRKIKGRLEWQVVWGHGICQKRGVDVQHNKINACSSIPRAREGKTPTRSVKGSKMNNLVPRGRQGWAYPGCQKRSIC